MEAILYIGLAQSIFAGIIILTKRPLTLADKILSGWLVAMAIWFSLSLTRLLFPSFASNHGLGGGLILLTYGPFLYLYSKYIIHSFKRFQYIDLLHYIPFILVTLIFIFYVDKSELFVKNGSGTLKDANLTYRLIFSSTFLFTTIFYAIKNFRQHIKHKKNIANLYANHSERITLVWLKTIAISFTVTFSLLIVVGMINIYHPLGLRSLGYVLFTGNAAMVYIISFFGYRQVSFIKAEPIENNEEKEKIETDKAPVRYEKSGLKNTEADIYLEKMLTFMKEHQLWRNNDLTVKELSEHTEIPKHYITQIINEKLHKNFYTFVNEYRIEEVKQMFKDTKYENWSILAIAEESGFNSKSAFNNFFKLYTGRTPSEFRKESNKQLKK